MMMGLLLDFVLGSLGVWGAGGGAAISSHSMYSGGPPSRYLGKVGLTGKRKQVRAGGGRSPTKGTQGSTYGQIVPGTLLAVINQDPPLPPSPPAPMRTTTT